MYMKIRTEFQFFDVISHQDLNQSSDKEETSDKT